MNSLLENAKKVVLELEKEHGSILVFALFLRTEPLERWDVVVSASWLNASDMNAYQLVGSKLQSVLNDEELLQISRIVILDEEDPAISFLQETISITNGKIEEQPSEPLSNRFGFTIKQAFILRCKKENS